MDYLWRSKLNILALGTFCFVSFVVFSYFLNISTWVSQFFPEIWILFEDLSRSTTMQTVTFGYVLIILIHPGLFRNGRFLKLIDLILQIVFVSMMLSLTCRLPYFKLWFPFFIVFLTPGAYRYQKKYAAERIEKYVMNPTRNISDSIMASPVMEPIRSSVFRQRSEPEEVSTDSIELETGSDQCFQYVSKI